MTVDELQHAIGTVADGIWGPKSNAALLAAFTNRQAPTVTTNDLAAIAQRLGCSVRQVQAVATVESAGAGFDAQGRPKILYERHIFHRLTGGRFSPAPFSDDDWGGYTRDANRNGLDDSWDKLLAACGKDPDAAFSACSWGRFQVMGMHWAKLGYASPYELARSTARSEAAHFELLARYVETFGLAHAMRALSSDPADCVEFARLYNGDAYRRNGYDRRLAREMA